MDIILNLINIVFFFFLQTSERLACLEITDIQKTVNEELMFNYKYLQNTDLWLYTFTHISFENNCKLDLSFHLTIILENA